MHKKTKDILSKLPQNISVEMGVKAGLSRSFFYWKCPLSFNYDTGLFNNHISKLKIKKPNMNDIDIQDNKVDNHYNEYQELHNVIEIIDTIDTSKNKRKYILKYGYLFDEYVFCKIYPDNKVYIQGNYFTITTNTTFVKKFISNTSIDNIQTYNFNNLTIGDKLYHAIYAYVEVIEVGLTEFACIVGENKNWFDYNGVPLNSIGQKRVVYKDFDDYCSCMNI